MSDNTDMTTTSHKPADQPGDLDLLKTYISQMPDGSLLTADQEKAIGRRVQAGDKRAAHELLQANLRLVVKIARAYQGNGVPLLDLIQEGNIGLNHAVRKFDPELGWRFSTYATPWIRQAVARAVMNQGRTVRLPVGVYDKLRILNKARRELERTLDREPSPRELAVYMEKPQVEIEEMLAWTAETKSIHMPIASGDGDLTLGDTIPDQSSTEDSVITKDLSEQLRSVLCELPERDRFIIENHYGLHGTPKTLKEIGEHFGITRERVRQIEQKVLDTLSEHPALQGM